MKTLIVLFLAALSSAAVAESENKCPTSNGYISTNVHAEAKTSFLQTVEHHWKFEFWRGAVCWGSPDDQYTDNQEFKKDSNQCVGNIEFKTDRAGMLNYTPMTLSWGANMTDGDTFKIELSDTRIRAVYDNVGGDCTSRHWSTKLDNANMVYETKAELEVPQDVWVVQVRAKPEISAGSTISELHPRIGRVALKNPEKPDAFLQDISDKTWVYLYVEPGEKLEVNLSYAYQGLEAKKKFNVTYEFKFIGSNRCVEMIGQPNAINYSDYLNKQILSNVTDEASFNEYAVKLGCLRNPVFLKAGMNNSGPDTLVPAMESIGAYTKKVIKQAVDNKKGVYAAPYMVTILNMTLVDLSRFALTDLHNYCTTYHDFRRETLNNPQVTEIPGVEKMMLTYSHLEKIHSQLLTKSLVTLVNNAQAWTDRKLTYAQLADGNAEVKRALEAYQQSMVQMGLAIYPTIGKELSSKDIPQVQINKTAREHLIADLVAANKAANEVNTAIIQMMWSFGIRSNEVVNIGQLSTNVQQLLDLHQKIGKDMHEYFKWFANPSDGGNAFVRTIETLRTEILQPSAETLVSIAQEEKLKSLDEKFVRRSEINVIDAQVSECISHPYGGGK